MKKKLVSLVIFIYILQCVTAIAGTAIATLPLPNQLNTGLRPGDLAIIVNDEDPLSRKIAAYYQARRHIPDENLIHVRFKPGNNHMSRAEFVKIKSAVDSATPENIQAYVLTWAAPYKVGCMSITTAFAAGFNEAFCSKEKCAATKYNPYFNSASSAPYEHFNLRPTMALAGANFNEVKKLIDRGIASDSTYPVGTGYLINTDDKARNVRAAGYPLVINVLGGFLNLQVVNANYIQHKTDVLFYFTGTANVAALETNRFVPGAIADHLTSTGGRLTGSKQMSSLRWLEAGVTGSYGTVVEPCNRLQKFPNPGVVISHYLQGETLIEAYWKSVAWPGEGIFIGEPLARPYGW